LDTPEMRALGHAGYDDVAADRQGVTEAWTSPQVRDAAARLGIELISYAELRVTQAATPSTP
jgi:chitin disaccharide deacetylase